MKTREITFELNGKPLTMEMGSSIKREHLYGRTEKVALDMNDQDLKVGLLTPMGVLLEPEEYRFIVTDAEGSDTGKSCYLKDGEELEPAPSSFKEMRRMQPAVLEDLSQFAVQAIYPIIFPEGTTAGVYMSLFNYNASPEPSKCFIIVQEGNAGFLLSGDFMDFLPVGPSTAIDIFDASDEEEEDSDFDFDF